MIITMAKPTINLYGIMILISITIGMFFVIYNLVKEHGFKIEFFEIFMLMFISIIGCGMLYTYILEHKVGLSSYGGLIGAILSAYLYERITHKKYDLVKYTILSLPLIYGISKIGCFFAGCCYGIPYNGPLAMNYVDGLDHLVFPVQLLEVVSNIILFFILLRFKNNKNIVPYTLVSTAALKYCTDFLRSAHSSGFIVTSNQIVSIVIVLIGIVLFIIGGGKDEKESK